MPTATPQPIRLDDYAPPPYLIDTVDLDFRLAPESTQVRSRLAMRPNPAGRTASAALVLDGETIALQSVLLDGQPLPASRYALDESSLTIFDVPQRPFSLEIVNRCNPQGNTALSGLYMSDGMYCTQCEAEGFRRITYFLDRPDVMARYRVRIQAPRQSFPVLLANGNPGAQGEA